MTVEILGDLKKVEGEDILNQEKVIEIANKLIQRDNAINVYYKNLFISSLMGTDHINARRPAVGGGKKVVDKDGRKGVHIEETLESITLRNWQKGNFEEAEKAIAQQWRFFSKSIDLERIKKNWNHYLTLIPNCEDFDKLNSIVERVLSNPDAQGDLLQKMIEGYQIDPKLASKIFYRWESNSDKLIKDFAPYSFYCIKVDIIFNLGLVFNLITTRPTNLVDSQYLFYLPFCNVFSSRDNFHNKISQTFLFKDQTFVDGDDLKNDLKNINENRESLTDEQKLEWDDKYSTEPPVNENSITYQLWKKYLPKWIPGELRKESSTSKDKMNKNKVDEITDRVNSFSEIDTDPFDKFKDDENEFVIVERWISLDDQCPCGSGKKFRECCNIKLKNA